jgi:glycosyltransferase involved in cell wall biosynthesis
MDVFLLYRIYRKVHPDLIVVSNICPARYIGLAILPKPFLGVIHTYPHGKSVKFISKMVDTISHFILNKMFAAPKKRLITVSEFSKQEILKSWGIPSDTVSVIYNFGGRNGKTATHSSVDDKFCVLTFGHVTYYKNPFIWINVAEKVINFFAEKTIEFIWGGDGDLLEHCRNNVAALGLTRRIKFIGYTSDVASYYAIATLYFQPSIIESHGISVAEAMSYSLPCVVSDIGGLPESVENGINGFLIPPDDTDAMGDAIIKLIADNSLRQKMGKNSLRIFEEKFSYSMWKQKMDELYINRIFGNAK